MIMYTTKDILGIFFIGYLFGVASIVAFGFWVLCKVGKDKNDDKED